MYCVYLLEDCNGLGYITKASRNSKLTSVL